MKRFLPLIVLLVAAPLVADAAPPSPKPSPTAFRKARPTPSPQKPKYPEVTTESGLIVQDIVIGKGVQPKPGQALTVNYRGRLLGGREFDSSFSHGRPFTFVLGDNTVIRGWEEGVATMRVGGRRRLVVPPGLGYGDRIVGTIPPDSTLEFDIELLDVK